MRTPAGSGLGSLVGRGVSFSPPGQGAQVPLPTVVSPLPPAGHSLTWRPEPMEGRKAAFTALH